MELVVAVRLTSFESISDWHRDLEAEFFRPENVVELITLAHTYAKGVSASGFFMCGRVLAAAVEDAQQGDAGDQSDVCEGGL